MPLLTGDYAKLASLRATLKAVPELKREIKARVAEKLQEQLDHQYATGTDPDNEAWAELAPSTLARGRKPPPLDDTGEMKRHSKAVAGLQGIRVRIDKPSKPVVPELHQAGTEHMPQRMIVPDPGAPVPAAWKAAVELGAGEVLAEKFGGAK